LGDPAGASELSRSSLDDAVGSSFAPATLRRVLAQATRATGDLEAANDHFLDAAEHAREDGVTGFAMELLVDHGLLVAELGDLDSGLEIIDGADEQAVAEGAAINAAWAHGGRGTAIALFDRERGIGELEVALADSRAIAYPAGVSFSLRGLAGARAAVGDDVGAAEALLELIDELLQRGGLTDLRMVLDVAAIVLERQSLPSWADLAVTARSLPVTSVGTPVHLEVFERAEGAGRALTIRDALIACRRDLRAVVGAAVRHDDVPEPAVPTIGPNALVRQGDVWRVAFAGNEVVITHSKGIADLVVLLRSPGREITAVDLMGAAVVGSGGDGLLDATARRSYEDRVRELQTEIDEADADNDIGRADLLRDELDRIVDELTTSLGLGGRARRSVGESERARPAVTQRIRGTIKRLAGYDEALGAHLRTSISTRTYCSYAPATPMEWTIEP
jgi:hypothetical protein